MNCQQRRLQIIALLDGAVEPEREGELESHLEECAGCRRFFDEQSEMDALFSSESFQLEPPAKMWDHIEAKIASPPRAGFWEEAARSFLDLFQVPVLRHALAALSLMTILSLTLLNLPRAEDRRLLTQLESYQVEVPSSNPFLPDRSTWNPFFQVSESGDNPFDNARSPR